MKLLVVLQEAPMPEHRPLILVRSIRRLHRNNPFHLLHRKISEVLQRKSQGRRKRDERKEGGERKKKKKRAK